MPEYSAFLDDNLVDRPSVEEDIALEANRAFLAIHTKAVKVGRTEEAEVIHIGAGLPLADHIEVMVIVGAIRTKVAMADHTAEEAVHIVVVVTCRPLVVVVHKAVEVIHIEEVIGPFP